MLDEALRRRLAELNRGPLPAGTTARSAPGQRLAELLHQPDVQVVNVAGRHARFERELGEMLSRPLERWPPHAAPHADPHAELTALRRHFPAGTLFLDLETCGFAGSMVFLIGLVRPVDGRLVVEQLLARSYDEEGAILESLWQLAAAAEVLVTFNGKSFDWPLVNDRTTRHRVRPRRKRPTLVHCDLLHHARRRWRTVLPDCKLQTLERLICRRPRSGDLPGAEVPAAYRHFVRTGQTAALGAILHHNALDLVTLVEIALRLAAEPAAAVRRLRAS